MRAAKRILATLLGRDPEGDQHVVEYAVILSLIVVVVVLSLLFLGDAVADLISLVGGRVDDVTLPQRD